MLIPTHDYRRPLGNSIKSFLDQKSDGDELLIGIDAHGLTFENIKTIERTILSFNAYPSVKYMILDMGHNCWGHCVINNLIMNAKGEFLTFMDDDDILTPDAFNKIRDVITKGEYNRTGCPNCGVGIPCYKPPYIFRVFAPIDNIHYWFKKDLLKGGVGGGCIVTPNLPERLGKFTCRYEGDSDFVEATVNKWGGKFEWRDEAIKNVRVAKDSKVILTIPPR